MARKRRFYEPDFKREVRLVVGYAKERGKRRGADDRVIRKGQ